MNIIDIVILIIIGLTALSGYNKGFILSLLSLVRIFLSIIISRFTYPYIIDFLTKNTNIYYSINNFLYPKIMNLTNSQIFLPAKTITDLVIRLFIVLIIYSIVNAILIMIIRKIDRFFKLPILNTLNTFAGLVFGLLKGVLIVFIIYTLLTPVIILNKESFIATNTMESALGMYFYNPDFLLNFLKNNYINFMNFMTL